MRNYSLKNLIWGNKGHEFDMFANRLLDKSNEYYLVGTGKEISSFIKRIGTDLIVNNQLKACILTEENEKYNEQFEIPIIKDIDIPHNNSTMVICVSRDRGKYEAVRQLCEGYGFLENVQFLQGEIFSMIYEVYIKDMIKIDRIEIFMTSHCNLSCRNCIAFIPYFKEKKHIPVEKLKKDADILFSKVDYVFKLKILGGEGLCYPYLIEYIDYLHQNYGNKIGSLRIGTNGTIIPSSELLEACKRDQATLDISDYALAVPNRSKMDDIISLCKENGVSVDIKRTGEQWLDMGFPNNIPAEKNEEQLRNHFFKCAMFCRDFYDGKLFFCCSNFAAVTAGLIDLNENDYFDFCCEFSKKELLEYELGYSHLGHTSFCRVCRGCSDESNPFHVEVAKQIEAK